MMDSDELLLKLDAIKDEYNSIVNSSFQEIGISSGGLDSGFHFHAELSADNWNYRNSEYFMPFSETTRFIHFTKIDRLFSILSEQSIRLYSLSNSNDEDEYNHTAQILNLSSSQIQSVKNFTCTFSLCEYSEIDDMDMWNDYAHTDGKEGCCIVFKICNDALKWKNFHFSKVKYNHTIEFEKFYKALKLLSEKYSGSTFTTTLDRLMVFHKTDRWKKEKEVRLSTLYSDYEGYSDRFDKRTGQEARISIDEDGAKNIRYINYTVLPLIGIDNGNSCSEKLPHIEIEKIVISDKGTLGYNQLQILQQTISRLANPLIKGTRTKYIRTEIRDNKH